MPTAHRLTGKDASASHGWMATWWPNPLWGAEDEAGSTNWYTKPDVVMRAISQIKTGKTYKLGHPYTADMPLFGARKFSLRIPGAPTGSAPSGNRVLWNDEFLATEIGQVGTQFDGLGHIGVNSGTAGNKASCSTSQPYAESSRWPPGKSSPWPMSMRH